jgi:DNA-binding CsgD family transcriptional regulator
MWRLLPAMALFFVIVQIGLLMASADQPNAPRQRLVFVFMSACQLGFALLLSLYRRRGAEAASRARRAFTPLLALGIPACIAAHLSFSHGLWPALSLLPNFFSGMFLPLLWAAFAVAVPPDRQGFCLGISVAVGEFVWTGLLPLSPHVCDASEQGLAQLAYLHVLQAAAQSVLCGMLIYLLRKRSGLFACRRERRAASPVPTIIDPLSREGREARDGRTGGIGRGVLFLLFLTEMLFFLLSGFVLGTAFPETVSKQNLSLYVPIILLAVSPAIGLLLDKNRHGVRLVAAFPVFSAFCIALAAMRIGNADFFLLVFSIGRDVIILLLWFVMLRLAGNSPFFPLWAALVLSLTGASYPGMGLARIMPSGMAGPTALGLALCFAALAAFLCRRLGHTAVREVFLTPDAAPDRTENTPPFFPDPPVLTKKAWAFAKAFALTPRETDIFSDVIRGLTLEETATERGISPHTVQFHLTNLLKKTHTSSRRHLLQLYATWNPDQRPPSI